jgi:hypothetical protein
MIVRKKGIFGLFLFSLIYHIGCFSAVNKGIFHGGIFPVAKSAKKAGLP